MSEAQKFDVDGPTQTRATVTFKNWGDEHGLVIRKEKLEQDAKNFRRIAKLLGTSNDTGESAVMAQMLMTMADQFQNASCGWDATAEAKPYDKPPEMVKVGETAQAQGSDHELRG